VGGLAIGPPSPMKGEVEVAVDLTPHSGSLGVFFFFGAEG